MTPRNLSVKTHSLIKVIGQVNFATFDLNLLRVLDALLGEGSTVKAANRLNMSQSAVSGALARLRDTLGDPLFVRHGNRLVPTEFASGLALPLRQQLDGIQALLSPARTFDPSTATGSFRIAATDFFAELLMPDLARVLSTEAPDITAQLVDLIPSDYIRSLQDHDADLVLIPNLSAPPWVACRPLFHASFVVIARQDHPATTGLAEGGMMPLDLFCDLGHVLMSPEGNLRAMGDTALDSIGRRRHVVLTLPVFSGVLRAVSRSDMIALVPRQLARAVATQFRLASFLPPFQMPAPLISAFWHARQTNSPQHRWLRERCFAILDPLNEGEKSLPTPKPSERPKRAS